ncbi:hypothetical protein [Merdimonas faecis]|nr:hypothetical protein [Merdimonas faecis]
MIAIEKRTYIKIPLVLIEIGYSSICTNVPAGAIIHCKETSVPV